MSPFDHAEPGGVPLALVDDTAPELRQVERAILRALEGDPPPRTEERARFQLHLGDVRQAAGNPRRALAAWEEALRLYSRLQMPLEATRVRIRLCTVQGDVGRWRRSKRSGMAALCAAARIGSRELEAQAALALGELALAMGELEEAEGHLVRASRVAAAANLPREDAICALRRAELATLQEHPEALTRAMMASRLLEHTDLVHQRTVAAILESIGRVRRDPGRDIEQELARYRQAMEAADAPAASGWLRLWTAELLLAADQVDKGMLQVNRVAILADQTGNVALRRRADSIEQRIRARLPELGFDDRMARVLELAVNLTRETRLDMLLKRICDAALDLVDGQRAFVLLGEFPEVAASSSRDDKAPGRPSMSVIRQAMGGKLEIIAPNLGERHDIRDRHGDALGDRAAVMCLPMLDGEEAVGAIYVDSPTTGKTKLVESAQLLRALASLAAVAVLHAKHVEGAVREAELAERRRNEARLQAQAEELELKNRELELKNRELELVSARLQASAVTDHLTSVGNRRAFQQAVARRHSAAVRHRRRYALVLADIDSFKQFNDVFGHQVGDRVLQAVAAALKSELRADDELFRYGGEEFIVLAAAEDRPACHRIGERLRQSVEDRKVRLANGNEVSVSISVGVALVTGDREENWEKALGRADKALYKAKYFGRNQVVTDEA